MMGKETIYPDQLLHLFDRLRKQALGQNPLEEYGISGPQLALINWIAASSGSGIREIAEGLDLSAPTVSVGVRKLEKAGLLERRQNLHDGRAIQVFLTEAGQAFYSQARVFRRIKMEQLLSRLKPEEGATLISLLEKAITEPED